MRPIPKTAWVALGFNIALLLFMLCWWAEWGPFAWAAAVSIAFTDSYGELFPHFVTYALFFVAIAYFWKRFASECRLSVLWATALPLAVFVVHFVATIYFLATGGSAMATKSFEEAVMRARIFPQAVSLDSRSLPALDEERVSLSMRKSRASRSTSTSYYVPFASSGWGDAETPVILKLEESARDTWRSDSTMEGTITYSPLPYIVRHSLSSKSLYGVIIEPNDSVRLSWLGWGLGYGLALIVGLASWIDRWRRTRAQRV